MSGNRCVCDKHRCTKCGEDYICNVYSWICPTLNGDENRNTCDWCELWDAVVMQRDYEEN